MKKKNYTPEMLHSFKNYLLRECSKFISSYRLKVEDIDKDFVIDGKTYTLLGMTNDNEYPIIMLELDTQCHYAVSKQTFNSHL
jgi:hypothetical protein